MAVTLKKARKDVGNVVKNAAYTAAGFGVGYGVVPAAAGYYAAQQAPYWFLREHAKAAAYHAAMRFAPHIAAGVTVGLPVAATTAYYIGSGLLTVAQYAMSKKTVAEPVVEPVQPVLADEGFGAAPAIEAIEPVQIIEPVGCPNMVPAA